MKHATLNFLFLCACIIIYGSCANVVSPTGGPKDFEPPKVLKTIPNNYNNHFKAKSILLQFNEFFELKDASNQVLVSPPLFFKPTFKVKNKNLLIEIHDTLRENTTYTINFGNSVQDITEGNKTDNYQYVFSTGAYIDSFSIKGNVNMASDNKNAESVLVMLYSNLTDSAIFKEKPLYFARTNTTGNFAINNIKDGDYKIFALKDLNYNYLYDLPNEEIAFFEDTVPINTTSPFAAVTTFGYVNDTLKIFSDSTKIVQGINLSIFQEDNLLQKLITFRLKSWLIKSNEINSCNRLQLYFKKPIDELKLIPLNNQPEYPATNINSYNKSRDTVSCWFIAHSYDTLSYILSDKNQLIDTIDLIISQETIDTATSNSINFTFSHNLKNSEVDLIKPIILEIPYPVINYDFRNIQLIEDSVIAESAASISDSINLTSVISKQVVPSIFFNDSSYKKILINFNWKEGFKYRLFIPDSIMENIFSISNDSISIEFKAKNKNQYGNIALNFSVDDSTEIFKSTASYIIQLLDDKENILEETIIDSKKSKINYNFLNPQKYKLKIIEDINNNRKWDTGNYLKKLQPERVFYYHSVIDLRANWDMEIDFVVR